jgi:hypothetical protein
MAAMASGDEEPDRPSNRVGDGVQLRFYTVFCLPNQTLTPPYFTADLSP